MHLYTCSNLQLNFTRPTNSEVISYFKKNLNLYLKFKFFQNYFQNEILLKELCDLGSRKVTMIGVGNRVLSWCAGRTSDTLLVKDIKCKSLWLGEHRHFS